MYLLQEGTGAKKDGPRVQLLGSGTILREVIEGAALLEADFGVAADVWSCPSFTELGRDGIAAERWNMLHPGEQAKTSFVAQQLAGRPEGPVVAATDYMRAFADQIRPYVDRRYRVLGTDGFGRSDFRRNLRRHFEVNRHYVVLAALTELAAAGAVPASAPADAVKRYDIDPDKAAPASA